MTNEIKSSPYRRHQDLEAGINRSDDDDDDPFYITSTKNALINRLRRWRQAALVRNRFRRFRYTLDPKKDEKKQQTLRKIGAHAQARQDEYGIQEARQQLIDPTKLPSIPNGEFYIEQEKLSSMTRDHNILRQYGEVKGLSDLLQTNLDRGISGADADIWKRRNAFGSNTYPQKKGRSFWVDVPLGSLARPYFDYIDDSCSGFFGAWYKDTGY